MRRMQTSMLSTGQAYVSQSVACRDRGEISSLYSDFALGDTRRSMRVWVLSRERNPEVSEIVRQFVGEYIPYEQNFSSILGNAKQLALRQGFALLVGSKHLWYIFLPAGFYVHVVNAANGKAREIGADRLLTLRYGDVSLMQNFHFLITSERLSGDLDRLANVLGSNTSEQGRTDAVAEHYATSGPLGLLSKTVRGIGSAPYGPMTLASVTSDRGQVRQTNEDCGSIVIVGAANEQGASRFTLIGVADGVGGLAAGEIASKIAISAGSSECIYRLLKDGGSDPATTFAPAFERANEKVEKVCSYTGKSMASTLSLGIVRSGKVWTGNAGDTRIYEVKALANRIEQLTVDHRLEREGPQSHVITRSLGSHEHAPDVSGPSDLENGDLVVSCSDGLHDLLKDDEILERTQSRQTPKEICSDLTVQANSRGGKDNITVATVLWKGTLGS